MLEKYLEQMFAGKLDFLPLEESLKLSESGIKLDTRFHWVVCTEELSEEEMTFSDIIEECEDIYGKDSDYLKIGDAYKEFDEFTLSLCPAPTYMDLLKYNE